MITFRVIARIQWLTVFLILYASTAFGQTTTGSISGTVKDMSGGVLASAQVVILDEDTGISRTLTTDSAGRYLATDLALGRYRVTGTQQGFQTMVRNGIELTVGQQAVVELILPVGASTQTVEVTGETSPIETTTATISALVATEQIENLPLNGRSLTDLALLTPGVAYNRTTGSSQGDGFGPRVTINGGRNEANLYMIDGTVANDRTGSTATTSGDSLGVEGVREFRIIGHNFPAEYGRNSAGVMTMVTRSGTNQFHGSLYEFVRNADFDARDFFNTTASAPPYKRNQFGGAVGGPVKKDRVFFFFNYEGLRQRQALSFVTTVPDANARNGFIPNPATGQLQNVGVVAAAAMYLNDLTLWPLPNGQLFGDGTGRYTTQAVIPTTESYFLQRGDFHLSDKDNVFVRYIFDPSSRLRLQPMPNFARHDEATHHYAMVSETHIFGAGAVNDIRYSFNRTTLDSDSTPLIPIPASFAFNPSESPSLGMGDIHFTSGSDAGGSLTLIGSKNGISFSPNNTFEFADSFGLIHGAHSLKFGGNFIRTQYNPNSLPGGGEYTFASLTTFLQGKPSQLTGNIAPPGLTTERGYREGIVGYFVQDDWKIRPNLTLNLGLRFEYQLDRTEVNGLGGHFFLTGPQALTPIPGAVESYKKNNWSPRFGLAWDPTGKGKTAVRFGLGVYDDQITGSVLPGTPNTFATNTAFSIKSASLPFPYGFPPNTAPKNASSIAIAQYPLPTPTSIHIGLDIQQQLTSTLYFRAGYVGTYSHNLTRFTEQNINTPQIQANGQPFWPNGASLLYPSINGDISMLRADTLANYNGLQTALQKTLGSGLMFGVSYTWAKALSESDADQVQIINNTSYVSLDAADPSRDYGLSGYDQRHTFVVNGQYLMPWGQFFTNRAAKAIVGGWTIRAIWSYGSGMPINVTMAFDNARNGQTDSGQRPDLIQGVPITSGVTAGCAGIPAGQQLGTPNLWFNPCAFGTPTPGTLGNLGRDTITGPNFDYLSTSLSKEMHITEKIKLEFRGEVFNTLNHPSFGLVQGALFTSVGVHAGNEGSISTTVSSARQIQLGLRLAF